MRILISFEPMNSEKSVAVWLSSILVALLLGIGAYFSAINPDPQQPRQDGTMSQAISQTDWTKGSKNPKVTLTEYSDFQCPACRISYQWVEEILIENKNSISFTYRHFPLPSHKNALPAAFASEAAGRQGEFWEMAKILFENQKEWSESVTAKIIFERYAKEIGLDVAEFRKDVASDDVKNKVEMDQKSGIASTVNQTPTLFINGKLSDNPRSKEELRALIEYVASNP